MNYPTSTFNDTKKIFKTKGTCSHCMYFVLNREFGHIADANEIASDLLAGGMLNNGQQCGMLWGSSLAVGVEAFRRFPDQEQATTYAITATQQVMQSFEKQTNHINCRDITGCDFSTKLGLAKFVVKSLFYVVLDKNPCMQLAQDWAPKALEAATVGFDAIIPSTNNALSCASLLAQKMGASVEESVTVAGFAGGMGLSGNACGALGAAIWMNALNYCKQNPGKTPPYFRNLDVSSLIKKFKAETNAEMECSKISACKFQTIAEHSEYIKNGGCEKLINLLAKEAS